MPMMFASKTPRDLNHDPLPHAWYSPNGFFSGRSGGPYRAAVGDSPGWRSEHAPRPEFDHVQHNAPNPILTAFRDHVAWRWVYLPEITTYAEDVETFDGLRDDSFVGTTPEQIDHACKVLQRLANLANDKEN
jgi:hypothetical protein